MKKITLLLIIIFLTIVCNAAEKTTQTPLEPVFSSTVRKVVHNDEDIHKKDIRKHKRKVRKYNKLEKKVILAKVNSHLGEPTDNDPTKKKGSDKAKKIASGVLLGILILVFLLAIALVILVVTLLSDLTLY